MVLFDPEQGVGDQVIGNLGPSVIVDQGSPVRMGALSGIQMLVQTGAVKSGKAVGISGEMGGHPVQDHADPGLVHFIHEEHEVLRSPVSGGRRVIADHLIAPGAVEGMLHDGHQLDMGIAHFLHIGNDGRSQLPVIAVGPVVLRTFKGSQVQLVHADGRDTVIRFFSLFQPLCVLPGKAGDVPDHGSRVRTQLLAEGIGIRLQIGQAAFGLELVFIIFPFQLSGDKDLKDSGIPQSSHLVDPSVPAVEVSHHAHPQGVGRPDRKVHALRPVDGTYVRAQHLVGLIMDPGRETVRILFADDRAEAVGIPLCLHRPVRPGNPVFIGRELFWGGLPFRQLLPGNEDRKVTGLVRQLHFQLLSRIGKYQLHPFGPRLKRLEDHRISRLMRPEKPVGVVVLRINDRLDLRPVHQFIQFVLHNSLPSLSIRFRSVHG